MARIGLNLGEKIQIGDKSYRMLNDALVDVSEILGTLRFQSLEGQDIVYTDDTSQPRRPDGTYPQIPTGEIRGVVLGLYSPVQKETLFVTVTDQSEHEIRELGIKYREDVDAKDIVITYSMVRDNQFKLFASSIAKKGQGAPQPQANQPKQEDKHGKEHKG